MPKELAKGLAWDERGAVGTLTLARPDRLNALTFDIYAALRDHFARLATRDDVRAVVLTGTGKGFCSGGDVEDIIGKLLGHDAKQLLEFTRMTCDVVVNMRACPQPIIAAINGTVAGAGCALALGSDVRIAVPEAKASFLFVKAGLSGADMGACYLLPRIVGIGRAAELLYTGDVITADEAHRIGLYNRIVPADKLMDASRALAERIADGPTRGIPVTKDAIERQSDGTLEEALDYDARIQAELMEHPDFREAYEAFREKRRPRYR